MNDITMQMACQHAFLLFFISIGYILTCISAFIIGIAT